MRRIVVLAGVSVALVITLALSGTSVLPKLSEDPRADDDATTAPPTPTPTSPSPPPTPTPTTAGPDEPLPGTVITARPAPRRCPSPPCVPAG